LQYTKARAAVLEALDKAVGPKVMSRAEYKELLGDLIAELEMRSEAAVHEDEEGQG